MRVEVAFDDERIDLDVPDGRLVGAWRGPEGLTTAEVAGRVARSLEEPDGFPPLRLAVVPGDHVVIALGPDVPEAGPILGAIGKVLESSGVAAGDVTVLAETDAPDEVQRAVPPGMTFRRHDPDDRKLLAYLATTSQGRRVYLNRLLTDADFVIPVGLMAYDQVFGYRGPWGVIFPGLSDTETRRAYRARATEAPPDRDRATAALKESNETGWLLGCQFQVGVVAGVTGMHDLVAGLGTEVFDRGSLAVDRVWGVQAGETAEVVVVGIGRPGERSGIDDLARGLATAQKLVRRGGKVVALSRVGAAIGPALRRLIEADDPRAGPAALRGHEADSDYPAACEIARALAWADVYLLSALDPDTVDGLSMIALDRPEEARRLVSQGGSCLVVSHADRMRAGIVDAG